MKRSVYLVSILNLILPTNLTASEDRSLLSLYEKSCLPAEATNQKTITYLGAIQFPSHFTETQTARIYHKGKIVPVENGSFSLSEPKKFQVFTIVAALLPPPTANTLEKIEIPKDTLYTVYTLFKTSAKTVEGKKYEEWHVEKETNKKGYKVPSDALIVLIDPTLIADITIHSWAKDSFTLKLPTLVLKKDLPKKTFNSIYNRSVLSALDWDGFHEREKWEHEKHKQTKTARRNIA
ncbi:MAG: hypothetical protein EBZ47_08640 [Chlamydiae bacterium]|nr:hypothetical protein [Chlamydiota bacterium]